MADEKTVASIRSAAVKNGRYASEGRTGCRACSAKTMVCVNISANNDVHCAEKPLVISAEKFVKLFFASKMKLKGIIPTEEMTLNRFLLLISNKVYGWVSDKENNL